MEKWNLAEGTEKLLTPHDMPDVGDLVAYKCRLTLDVSFAVVEDGISVILSPEGLEESDRDDNRGNFSVVFVPDEGETLLSLLRRIAQGLGINPDDRIWEDADALETTL